MKFRTFSKLLAIFAIICSAQVSGQFWKLNSISDKDLFIMDTKASMASGICYKLSPGNATDPQLRMQIISHCCVGYQRNLSSTGMQCDPICTEDCSNGICTAPDVCDCYPGYERMGGRCEQM